MRPGGTFYVILTAKSYTRDITLPLTPNCRIENVYGFIYEFYFSVYILSLYLFDFLKSI